MRYCTFELGGKALAGIVDGDRIVPFPGHTTVREILELGEAGRALAAQALAAAQTSIKLSDAKLLPPVPNPDKVLCIGLNYRDHAEHSGAELPTAPRVFNKFGSSLVGCRAPIRQTVTEPRDQCLDWEVEQIVVVGRRACCVPEAEAWAYVGGYMTGNDVSERMWQLGGKNGPLWTFGKGFDTSGVCGPWLVTADEITPEQASNMDVKCWYNGELVQSSNTKQHIFTVPQVIAHVSKMITLLPGDLIYMGTPMGTAVETAQKLGGFKNVKWMRPGGVLKTEVVGLGVCENAILGQEEYFKARL